MSTTAFARPLDRPADEGSAAVTSLHQTYACSVPEGYVFSDVRTKYSCSPGTTNGKEFLLLDYVNYNLSGVWSCQVPPGYTYTSIRTAYFCSPGTTSGQQFLLSG